MMFRYSLDLPGAADAIEQAVSRVLADGYRTQDIQGSDADKRVGTRHMGELVLERL